MEFENNIVITYFNNFEKLKHKIYLALNETSENGNSTTSFVLSPEGSVSTIGKVYDQFLVDLVTERENNLQRVGIADGATN